MFSRLTSAVLILLFPLASLCQSSVGTLPNFAASPSGGTPNSAQSPLPWVTMKPKTPARGISHKQERQADNAYLAGARLFGRLNFEKAQLSFEQAVSLDPHNRTYVLALLYAREVHINGLMREAFKARLKGDYPAAEKILTSARRLDPTNPLVVQYADGIDVPRSTPLSNQPTVEEFESPMALSPFSGVRSFHQHGEMRQVVTDIYSSFGIVSVFDASVASGKLLRIDLDDVDFAGAVRVLQKAARLLTVPIDSTKALLAADTKESRETLTPLVEQTIYLTGQVPQQQLMDLASAARTLFDLTQVAVNAQNGAIVVRGPRVAVQCTHDLLMELTEGTTDVLLDMNIYEVDKSTTRKIGFVPPTSATGTDVSSTALKLISDNQTVLNQAISSGTLTLSGSTYEQELEEVSFLVAAGASGGSSLTGIMGTLGSLDGIPLLGISMGSTSLNMLLSSTDARILNALRIRCGDREETTFRVGSRYPIMTAITTSASSSSVATELAAAGVSSSVIAQLTGSSSGTGTSRPQIQFEDIGLTLKVTPRVLRTGEVQLALDLKLESLGGTGVDAIPILNNRALKSAVTISPGQTAMLAALVSTNEVNELNGVPGLDGLPGFQSTEKNADGTKDELLITVTPHIVSGTRMRAGTNQEADKLEHH